MRHGWYTGWCDVQLVNKQAKIDEEDTAIFDKEFAAMMQVKSPATFTSTLVPLTDCTLAFSLASHTYENPYLCILRRGMQPARDISIFRTGLHRSRRSELPNSYDISDLLGIRTSRLEWSEARISVGPPLQHMVAIGDSLPH